MRLAEGQGALFLFGFFGFTNSVKAHNDRHKTSTSSGSQGPKPSSPVTERKKDSEDSAVKITPSNGGDVLNAIMVNNADTLASQSGGETV